MRESTVFACVAYTVMPEHAAAPDDSVDMDGACAYIRFERLRIYNRFEVSVTGSQCQFCLIPTPAPP